MIRKSIVLACAFMLALVAAGPAAMAAPIIFKVATAEADGTSTSIAFREFEKFVEEKTNGQVDVQYYPANVLGGEREIVEGVALGTIQLCFPASSVLSMYGDKFNLLELPFVYDGYDAAYAAWEGETGRAYSQWMEDQGFLNLGLVGYTAHGFANTVRPVRTPADMKGIKVRVIESQMYIDLFKAFGSNPTAMNAAEIYMALQQGTIQAIEQGPMQVYMEKYYERLPHYTWLQHIIMPAPFIVQKSYFEKLPEDARAAILEGIEIMKAKLKKQLYDDEVNSLEDMRKAGVEVIAELTPEEIARFRALSVPIHDQYRKIVGDEVFDKMLSYSNR